MSVLKGYLRVVSLFALGSFVIGEVSAIVIRDDKDEALYREYAKSKREFDAVGMVQFGGANKGGYATGTLIHPQFILTAAHVADVDPDAKDVRIVFSSCPSGDSKVYRVVKWVRHPHWIPGTSRNHNPQLFGLGFDFAVGMLAEEVKGVAPVARFNRRADGSEEGRLTSVIGYGRAGTGITGAISNGGCKLGGTNTIEYFDHFAIGRMKDPFADMKNRIYFTEFKNPKTGPIVIKAIKYMLSKGMPSNSPKVTDLECSFNDGDSGGASFVNVGGKELLSGVCSFTIAIQPNGSYKPGDSKYGNVSGYGAVSVVNDWIDSTIKSLLSGESSAR